jgi:hypothetical protein
VKTSLANADMEKPVKIRLIRRTVTDRILDVMSGYPRGVACSG